MAKSLIDIYKVQMLEKLLDMKVDHDEVHDVKDINCLSKYFLCNLPDKVYIVFDHLKVK